MRILAASAALGLLLITACGTAANSPAANGPAPSSSAPKTIAVLAVANGKTISAVVGQRIDLTLSSTYWNVAGSSAPRIVRQDGPPVLLPRPASCPKIPGLGCVPERVGFTAIAPGTAVITASRTTCGEALRCRATEITRYALTVIVRRS